MYKNYKKGKKLASRHITYMNLSFEKKIIIITTIIFYVLTLKFLNMFILYI